ncbi:Uncharacterized protein C8035_v010460 [Colletotrichum spinosum]|uniref:WKF domain-containing protein n=1 Tax=Colletotrichum spinosum TaxID=1347390 RepID=A0A4R8PP76_9PEZI|nr:Uncharacterized protein C8035_v010460 [Colletotrichum spinosum]
MSAKIPAWKRLGLKLKQPASGSEIGSPASASAEPSQPNGGQHHDFNGAVNAASAAAAKKKRSDHFSPAPPAYSSPLKRTRTDDHASTPPTLRKQKSVTFADDTKRPAAAEPTSIADAKKKKSKKSAKQVAQAPKSDIKPALEYLRHWKSSRVTWKFNKNSQTGLIKRIFLPDSIPASDIDTLYDYLQDLKGYTRTRLREHAAEIKHEDLAKGKLGFPEGTPNMDSKQSEYEKVIAGLMQLGKEDGNKKRRFDEQAFIAQATDVAVTQRVVKRMRAETILDELSESEDSDAMTVDTEETTPKTNKTAVAEEDAVDKRVKLNDGTKQNAPRRRKQRTANVDDSSSDESSDDDSDGDDGDSSDESSDDDSDNASEIQRQAAQRDAETSSSSSSSSEAEDDDSDDSDSSEEEENTKKPAGKRK